MEKGNKNVLVEAKNSNFFEKILSWYLGLCWNEYMRLNLKQFGGRKC